MWRKVGAIFNKVKGVNIGAVNCDEEGPDGVNRACTTCKECFPDYPVQAIDSFPAVKGFFGGETKESKFDDITPESPLRIVRWIFHTYPDCVDAATKERIIKEAEVLVDSKELLNDEL
jgi:hypothetical protein